MQSLHKSLTFFVGCAQDGTLCSYNEACCGGKCNQYRTPNYCEAVRYESYTVLYIMHENPVGYNRSHSILPPQSNSFVSEFRVTWFGALRCVAALSNDTQN